MLSQIDVVYGNEAGIQALALPIIGITPKDSLLIREVTGLNPPDKDLYIGDYSRDGGIYQGRRVGNRNVVMMIDLNPNPALGQTVSGLRAFLFKIFEDPLVDADHLQLILHDDELPDRYLVGYTENFESDVFSIETMVQASLLCPDPFIRDVAETALAHPTGWATVPFTYKGTARTGFQVRIRVTTPTSKITLVNNGRSMVIEHNFAANDLVLINTIRGERDVNLILGDGTVVAPLIAKLSNASRWLELHSQVNVMTCHGENPGDGRAVVMSLNYRASYWGV